MKQFIIIGCGNFGYSIAKTLYGLGHQVMIVDQNEEIINSISDSVTYAIRGDATDEKTIKSLGVNNFDVAIITTGSDIQSSILIGIMLKELGVKYIVAKAQNELHAKVLYKIGVDKVVFPERDMGARIAQHLVSPNIMDYIELSAEYSIVELAAIEEWIGKSLIDLNMRERYEINVMAIKQGENINISPNPSYLIKEDDVLVVVGHNNNLKKLAVNI
jgi:trk system potassium uptake protein TrkA